MLCFLVFDSTYMVNKDKYKFGYSQCIYCSLSVTELIQ